MSLQTSPARLSRLSLVTRSVGRPALAGVVLGLLAVVMAPATATAESGAPASTSD